MPGCWVFEHVPFAAASKEPVFPSCVFPSLYRMLPSLLLTRLFVSSLFPSCGLLCFTSWSNIQSRLICVGFLSGLVAPTHKERRCSVAPFIRPWAAQAAARRRLKASTCFSSLLQGGRFLLRFWLHRHQGARWLSTDGFKRPIKVNLEIKHRKNR